MLSVIIPLYNKANPVKESIRSVLAQTYQDYEIVVVDDGSTDDSAAIVKAISDSRIRLICQENAGVSAARNRGIAEAKGEYVAFLDADDLWKPDFLETMMSLVDKYPQCDVFAVDYELHYPTGNLSYNIINKLPFGAEDGELTNYFEVAACSNPPICSISVMMRRSAIETIGGFPLGIRSGEDLLTWARLACKYRIAYSRKRLAIYNMGEGYDMSNLPPRRQDEDDPVGRELKKLYSEHKDIQGLRNYISMWHKMRASVAVRYGECIETLREVCLSLWYNPLNFKVMAFVPLALLPLQLRKMVIKLR